MSANFCQHVKVDGTLCQVPPLNGRHHCHFHIDGLGRRIRMARARARREPYHLVLPILEDLNSVQVARQQVMDAMLSGQLDQKLGGRLLFGLQGMANDFRSAKPPRLAEYDPAIDTAPRATEYPNFEEKHGLPPDIDLSKPPEILVAADAAEHAITKAEPSPYRDELFRTDYISPEDVELEDILKKQGEQAYQQRVHELNQKAMQKVNARRREIQRAQYVVEAARRNTEIICGTPEERERTKAEVEKMRAEAAAQFNAQKEAQAKAAQSASDELSGATAVEAGNPPATAPAAVEAGKKPSATAPDEDKQTARGTGTNNSGG
jgi:hypothetical protein